MAVPISNACVYLIAGQISMATSPAEGDVDKTAASSGLAADRPIRRTRSGLDTKASRIDDHLVANPVAVAVPGVAVSEHQRDSGATVNGKSHDGVGIDLPPALRSVGLNLLGAD